MKDSHLSSVKVLMLTGGLEAPLYYIYSRLFHRRIYLHFKGTYLYLFMYVSALLHVYCLPEESIGSLSRWSWAAVWSLGTELRTCARAASALTCWASSPDQGSYFVLFCFVLFWCVYAYACSYMCWYVWVDVHICVCMSVHMSSSETLAASFERTFPIDQNLPLRLDWLAILRWGSFCLHLSGAGIKSTAHDPTQCSGVWTRIFVLARPALQWWSHYASPLRNMPKNSIQVVSVLSRVESYHTVYLWGRAG